MRGIDVNLKVKHQKPFSRDRRRNDIEDKKKKKNFMQNLLKKAGKFYTPQTKI